VCGLNLILSNHLLIMQSQHKNYSASNLRKTILRMAYAGSTVHIACAFSIVEIVCVLYRNYLSFPNNDPNHIDRDYFILSKGHGVMALYAAFYEKGWLSDDDIDNYFKDGTELKGLSDSRIDGLEVTSGSLGHGFSVAVGLAHGLKLRSSDQMVYALIGDGELNEGAIWEGMLFAAHHKLDNLILIVDVNGYQAMGATSDIIELKKLNEKFKSFSFLTLEINGHDEEEIDKSIKFFLTQKNSPKVILANTVKGKGVSFMENQNEWHYTRLNHETYKQSLDCLDSK
jgi:transketolase